MKYQPGETVILLDTMFKPVANATIKEFNAEKQQYLVEYSLHTSSNPQEIWISPERLTTGTEILPR